MTHIRNLVYFILLILLLGACVPQGQTVPTVEVTAAPPTEQVPSPTPETPTTVPTETAAPTETIPPSPTTGESHFPGSPILIQSSADLNNRVISQDPGDPDRLAYCAPGEIRVSPDAGQTWSTIPVAGVAAVAESLGYPIFPPDPSIPPQCFSVTLDAAHPESFFAVFSTALEDFGAPPIFYMGFFTVDNGAIWQSAPFPEGASLETFGGFYSDDAGTVQSLYSAINAGPEAGFNLPVLQTTDGGANWSTGTIECPPSGPCLRWGPASYVIPGMGSPLPQFAAASPDGAQSWEILEPAAELRVAPPNQLAAFSELEALRIAGSIVFSANDGSPVLITEDGAETWAEFPLPPLPDASPGIPSYPGLQILPDGSLLSQGAETADWWMLAPDSEDWCALQGIELPSFPVELRAANGYLLWVSAEDSSLVQVPLEDVACGEE